MESLMASTNLRGRIAMIMICQRDGEDKTGVGIPRPQKSISKRQLLESNKGLALAISPFLGQIVIKYAIGHGSRVTRVLQW
jgi:hypothetical protein